MKRRRGLTSLIGFVLVAFLAFGMTMWKDWRPLLGLDLQGGVSVVLKPTNTTDQDKIDQAITIMNQRVNALGVAEPDIHQQGDTIVVQIAGVSDRDKAIDLVGKTAELRFRPVLSTLPPETATPPGSTPPGSTPPGSAVPGADSTLPPGVPPDGASTTVPGAAVQSTPPTSAPASSGPPISQQGMGAGGSDGESAMGAQAPTPTAPPVSDAPPTSAVTPAPNASTPAASDPTASTPAISAPTAATPGQVQPGAQTISPGATQGAGADTPTTPPEQDDPTKPVVLPQYDAKTGQVVARYSLGPAEVTGKALDGATATLDTQTGQWQVNPKFKDGPDGIDLFNNAAKQCKPPSQNCPGGALAITLDGRVISAPKIEPQEQAFKPFSADQIQISGSFDEDSAKALATSLRYGALPVELEKQSTELVSATLGHDALTAGLVAGFVGLVLVALYMITFYRLLGALAIVKLGLEAMLLWSIVSYLGSNAGLALTLAGVTGIIVSIGVSLDSNVVYYEHLREDVRNGRTVRSAVDKSFSSAFGTILKADGASLLGAALLYWLAVGPVRGFAFYLGLSTLLDLISSYFYMRPVVALSTRSKLCRRRPGLFGLPPIAAQEVPESSRRPSKQKKDRKGRRAGSDDAVDSTDDESTDDTSEDSDEPVDSATRGAG